MKNKGFVTKAGFTLVELLVVIAIIGVLASIGLVSFRSAQFRSRDAQRKSDLKQISSALELFYSDYGHYPPSLNGQILGCGYNASTGVGIACSWGTSEFRDTDADGNTKTVYFKALPKDKVSEHSYYYTTTAVNSIENAGFKIYAYLENPEDQSIITTEVSCGSGIMCNFGLSSSNTSP